MIHSEMNRRSFIRDSLTGSLGLTLGLNGWWQIKPLHASAQKSRVVVGRSDAVMDEKDRISQEVVDRMLDAVMMRYTDQKSPADAWKTFFTPKDVVGLKVNVMMTATHTELIRSIVLSLKNIGIPDDHIIIWDRNRAGVGEEGITRRDKQFGFAENSVSKIITEHATALINVPGTKTHWLSGIAVAVKNWCGAVTNINVRDRNVAFRIHNDHCRDVGMIPAVPDIKKKIRLNIVDALMPLFHGGPQVNPEYLWQNKELLVSTDQVAVDAVCLKKIQEKRLQYKGEEWPLYPPPVSIAAADQLFHLGTSDLDKIDIEELEV